MDVLIFQGGECVTDDHHVVIDAWTQEAIVKALIEREGTDEWLEEQVTFLEGNVTVRDTFEFVNVNMAQIVLDGYNGGMLYIIRC